MLLWLVRRFSRAISARDERVGGIPESYQLVYYEPCWRGGYYACGWRMLVLKMLVWAGTALTNRAAELWSLYYWAVIDFSASRRPLEDVMTDDMYRERQLVEDYIRKEHDASWLQGAKTGWRAAGLVLDSLMPRRTD